MKKALFYGYAFLHTSFLCISSSLASPSIENVTSSNDDKTYKIGDEIIIEIQVSTTIDIDTNNGSPYLTLETGNIDRKANYQSFSNDKIYFSYIVNEGDESQDLNYIDNNSFNLNGAEVFQNTSDPRDHIVIQLPDIGESFMPEMGSLWDNKDIVIDGIKPIISIDSDLMDDNYFNKNEETSVSISGNTDAEIGQIINIEIEDIDNNKVTNNITIDGNTWSKDFDLSSLSDGILKITVNTSDIAGNESSHIIHNELIKDTTKPTIDTIKTIDSKNISVKFSEKLKKATKNDFAIEFKDQGETVEPSLHINNGNGYSNGEVTFELDIEIPNSTNTIIYFNKDWSDGITDIAGNQMDNFNIESTTPTDTDQDGTPDNTDNDDDNDGILDNDDAFPLDSSESIDTDSDGTGNNTDTDDDNDGILDSDDAFPLDNNESVDTDGDGAGNNSDTDDDNDGVLDNDDAFPLDSTKSSIDDNTDTDQDGTPDSIDTDDDNDGVLDNDDAFPLDSSESIDTDSDGTGNNTDTDDDNDGVLDNDDAFPLDSSESIDTDSDGTGNNTDTDDDNDGILDNDDAFPLDSTKSSIDDNTDTDQDGTPDNTDNDDDNDGVLDNDDAFPLDSTKSSIDTDSDGTDTDQDGTPDNQTSTRNNNHYDLKNEINNKSNKGGSGGSSSLNKNALYQLDNIIFNKEKNKDNYIKYIKPNIKKEKLLENNSSNNIEKVFNIMGFFETVGNFKNAPSIKKTDESIEEIFNIMGDFETIGEIETDKVETKSNIENLDTIENKPLKINTCPDYLQDIEGYDPNIIYIDSEDPYIMDLTKKCIVKGIKTKNGNLFFPDNHLTRSEATQIIIRAFGNKYDLKVGENPFPDVNTKNGYSKYLKSAKDKGWIMGYKDGLFHPEKNLSKVEALAIVSRASNVKIENYSQTKNIIKDIPKDSWYNNLITWAVEESLIKIIDNKVFPNKLITKKEYARQVSIQLQKFQESLVK
jgi:hypothetical protein